MDRLSDNELDNLLHQLNYALHALGTLLWANDSRIEKAYDEIACVKKEAVAERVRRLSSTVCASRDEIDEQVRRLSRKAQ